MCFVIEYQEDKTGERILHSLLAAVFILLAFECGRIRYSFELKPIVEKRVIQITAESERFRSSLICTAHNLNKCLRYEPRIGTILSD